MNTSRSPNVISVILIATWVLIYGAAVWVFKALRRWESAKKEIPG